MPVAPDRTTVPSRRRALLVAAAVAAAATAVYAWVSLGQWTRWDTPSWDLAIFSQLAQSYSRGAPPVADLKGYGFDLLGDHFHPLLVVLGPLWAVWPSPLALLLLQDVLLGTTAGVLAWFGTRRLGVPAGLGLGTATALSFGVVEAVRVQFHEVALAAPLLALSMGLLSAGRYRAGLLWAAPVALVKEDLGATVAVIGLVAAWTAARAAGRPRRPGDWPWGGLRLDRRALGGLVLALWGAGVSALAVGVVLPALNPRGTFDYADRISPSAVLGDPWASLAQFVWPWTKAGTLGLLLLVGLGAFLRSRWALAGVPTLLWRFLSSDAGFWGTTWHYSLVLMPILFVAVLDAAVRARPRLRAAEPRAGEPLRRIARRWTAAAPVLVGLLALVLAPFSGLAAEARDQVGWARDEGRIRERVADRQAALEEVPESVTVATDLSLVTRLVPGRRVLWIGTAGDPAPDYAVVDRSDSAWNGRGPQDPAAWLRGVYGAAYSVTAREGDVVVLRRT